MLILDVPTRWNSTYLMLDVDEKFEQAFHRFEYVEVAYVLSLFTSGGGSPKDVDQKHAHVFEIFFLKVFYDATLSLSGSLHFTANNFFKMLIKIQKSLNQWRHNDDLMIQKMTANMQLKFNKYWKSSEINHLLLLLFLINEKN